MKHDRGERIWTGVGLIVAGVLFAIATFADWDRVWPLFPLAAGVAFWVGYFVSGARDGGLAFVGTAALLIGLFFFGFTLGYWDWEEMAQLWPVFVLIGGVSFLALFIAERRGAGRDLGVLGLALAALIAGVAGLLYTSGQLNEDIWKYWPVLIILIGVLALIGAARPRPRKL
jgi:hypothetical protein